jgi:hypothetical protein
MLGEDAWARTVQLLPELVEHARRLKVTPMEPDEDPEDYSAAVHSAMELEEGRMEDITGADLAWSSSDEFPDSDAYLDEEPDAGDAWDFYRDVGSTAATPDVVSMSIYGSPALRSIELPDVLTEPLQVAVEDIPMETDIDDAETSVTLSTVTPLRTGTQRHVGSWFETPLMPVDPHRDKT